MEWIVYHGNGLLLEVFCLLLVREWKQDHQGGEEVVDGCQGGRRCKMILEDNEVKCSVIAGARSGLALDYSCDRGQFVCLWLVSNRG